MGIAAGVKNVGPVKHQYKKEAAKGQECQQTRKELRQSGREELQKSSLEKSAYNDAECQKKPSLMP